jgi:hypothetical protein
LPRDEVAAEALTALAPRRIGDLAAVEQVIKLALGRTQECGRFVHGELLMQAVDRCGATVIAVLLAPTIVTHRTGRHSLNHALGIVNNGIITVALIGSVSLLVATLGSHKQAPLRLLRSGAELWLTNVLVFSLWYWRLDGGGPNARDQHPEFGSRSFVFPQMQIEKSEREQFGVEHWRPGFVDYLFIAFTQSSTFGPTDAPLLARWAKLLTVVQIFISLSIVILLIARAVGVL